jgi:hypothetical protein
VCEVIESTIILADEEGQVFSNFHADRNVERPVQPYWLREVSKTNSSGESNDPASRRSEEFNPRISTFGDLRIGAVGW